MALAGRVSHGLLQLRAVRRGRGLGRLRRRRRLPRALRALRARLLRAARARPLRAVLPLRLPAASHAPR